MVPDLDQMALGDATPKELLGAIREALKTRPEAFAQEAYVALRSVVLRILSGRRAADLPEWVDLIRQTAGIARRQGDAPHAERLLALSDITTDWMRVVETHSVETVLDRPHVRAILHALRNRGGNAERAQVLADTKIGSANLSRILGSLEAVGLIERDKRRVRTIALMPAAERALNDSVAMLAETEGSGMVRQEAPPAEQEAAAARTSSAGQDCRTMDDLFVHTLRDIYYAENQMVKLFPGMIDRANDPALRQSLFAHLRETENHVRRLDQVFRLYGAEPNGISCPAIDGIIEEAKDVTGEVDPSVLDAALIAAAQAIEHYEITRYGTLIAWANHLGRSDCAALLNQNLDEEKIADKRLTALSEAKVKYQAA